MVFWPLPQASGDILRRYIVPQDKSEIEPACPGYLVKAEAWATMTQGTGHVCGKTPLGPSLAGRALLDFRIHAAEWTLPGFSLDNSRFRFPY